MMSLPEIMSNSSSCSLLLAMLCYYCFPIKRALETAKSIFPGKVSIDLIFGRPHQTLDAWHKELDQVRLGNRNVDFNLISFAALFSLVFC